MHAISVGAGAEEYAPGGSRRYSVEEFLRPFERTAAFCRAEYQTPFLFYGAGYRSEEDIRAAADELVDRLIR
jgi:putative NADPH-quinone reductase